MKQFVDTEELLLEVLEKQVKPYFKKHAKFCLDFETWSLFDPENEDLYKVPKPIRIPGRWVCSRDTRREFFMQYEGYVATMQLGADPRIFDKQWIFDVKKLGEGLITKHFKEILENSLVIGHNLKYESMFLMAQFNIWLNPTKVRDTQLIEQVILAGRKDKVNLGECYKRRLDYGFFLAETGKNFEEYEKHKEEMQQFYWGVKTYPEENLQYGADDVRFPFYLYESQKEYIEEFKKKHPGCKIIDNIKAECATIVEMALAELRGITFDIKYQKEMVIPYLERKYQEAYDIAITYFPNCGKEVSKGRGAAKRTWRELNFGSSQQVINALASLGIEIPNAQEDTLKEIRRSHPAIEQVLQVRKAKYLLSTFGYKLLRFIHEDGKIHPNFRQIGTETSRLSGNNPNMQQIPSKEKLFKEIQSSELFRKAFIADCYRFAEVIEVIGNLYYKAEILAVVEEEDECVVVDSDFANIEPRIIAQVAGPGALRKAFNNNVDYHGFTAMNLLSLPSIPLKGTWEREIIGKIGNLALGYLAGDEKTAEIMYVNTLDQDNPVVWTAEEARAKKEAYFDAIPEVKNCIQENRTKVYKHFEHFSSLAEFAGRKPIYTQFTRHHGRHRSWYLSEKQEALAKYKSAGDPRKHPLHKYYVKVNEETGEEDTYNMFKQIVSNIIRESYNFLMQAESACILKSTMRLLGKAMRESGIFELTEGLIMTVHDELVLNVRKKNQQIAEKMLVDCMKAAGAEVLRDVPVKAEAGSSVNWAGAKP